MKHESIHRVNGRLKRIPRNFEQSHLDAGYHEQEWGPHAHKDSPVLGRHAGCTVRFLADGPTGPEFELELDSGVKLTVLCEDVVRQYLEQLASRPGI